MSDTTPTTEPTTENPPEAVVADRPGAAVETVVHTMPWWQILLVRAARASLASLIGGASATALFAPDSGQAIRNALISAGGAFVWSLLQNGAELLAKLDQTNPGLRA